MTTAPMMFLYMTALPSMAGVAVGHPVPTVPVKTGFHMTIDVDVAEASVSSVVLVDDTGTKVTHPIGATINLLTAGSIQLPAGHWTEATVVLSGPIRVEGTGVSGGTFTLDIEVGAIFLGIDPSVNLDAANTEIKLGQLDWLTATELGLSSGANVHVDITHSLHDTIRDAFRYSSTWE